MENTLKVSESVCAGHPDKLADQISDAIVDAALAGDKNSRVAAEVLVAKDTVVIAGEVSSQTQIDYESIIREVITSNGYEHPEWGFDTSATIINRIHEQSPEIAVGVNDGGAGDQGLMYGYATNETDMYLPLPIAIAHALCERLDTLRTNNKIPYLRPDGKAQVVVEYINNKPVSVRHITIAAPHDERINLAQVKEEIIRLIITPVLAQHDLKLPHEIIVNGTGVWHMPGPASDVGLTGRKIVVDTYGGAARVGGGAFSGKDPSKVDRSGAYAARYIAKNLVANGYADKVEICLAYYIGATDPVVRSIEHFGTAKVSSKSLQRAAESLLDCSVLGIINYLDLRRPIYQQTAVYGHFGKPYLPWEKITKIGIV